MTDIDIKSTLPLPKGDKNIRMTTKRMHNMVRPAVLDMQLPIQSAHQLGCFFCEWRGTSLCTYKIPQRLPDEYEFTDNYGITLNCTRGKGKAPICRKRQHFIKYLYTGKSLKPRHKRIMMDYRQGMLELGFQKDWNRIFILDDEIDQLNKVKDPDSDTVKVLTKLKNERDVLTDRSYNLGLNLRKIDERGLDRESRDKNVDKLTNQVSMSEIDNIIRGNVYEADLVDKDE